MTAFPGLVEMRLHHGVGDAVDVQPVPAGFVVLVDQARPHPFAEFGMPAAVQAQGVFHLEHLGQGQVPGSLDLFPDQAGGQWAAFAEGFRRPASRASE